MKIPGFTLCAIVATAAIAPAPAAELLNISHDGTPGAEGSPFDTSILDNSTVWAYTTDGARSVMTALDNATSGNNRIITVGTDGVDEFTDSGTAADKGWVFEIELEILQGNASGRAFANFGVRSENGAGKAAWVGLTEDGGAGDAGQIAFIDPGGELSTITAPLDVDSLIGDGQYHNFKIHKYDSSGTTTVDVFMDNVLVISAPYASITDDLNQSDIQGFSSNTPTPLSEVNIDFINFTLFDNLTESDPSTGPPVVIALNPVDGGTDVLPWVNLEATFNEPVTLKDGGTITITDLTDGTSTETITLPDPRVTSITGSDLTIDLVASLEFGTHYSVRISSDAVEDQAPAPNAFGGILDDTTWDFTTKVGADEIANILLVTFELADQLPNKTIEEAEDLMFHSTENVDDAMREASYGQLAFHLGDGSGMDPTVEIKYLDTLSADTTPNALRIRAQGDLTAMGYNLGNYRFILYVAPASFAGGIDGAAGLGGQWSTYRAFNLGVVMHELGHCLGGNHSLQDPGCAIGRAGVNYAAEKKIRFGWMDAFPGTVTDVTTNTSLTLVPLSEDPATLPGMRIVRVTRPDGLVYHISYRVSKDPYSRLSDPAAHTQEVFVSLDLGGTLTNHKATLGAGEVFSEGMLKVTCDSVAGDGLSAGISIELFPILDSLSPADNTLVVPVDTNLVATFSEIVRAGAAGFITLKRIDDDSTVESFDVTHPSQVSFSGAQVTVNPTNDLVSGAGYYVLIDAGAIEDADSNPFAGIASRTTWSFGGSPPVLASVLPIDDSYGAAVDVNPTASFNVTVQAGSGGFVTIRSTYDDSIVESFDVTSSPRLTFSGMDLVIDPTSDLELDTGYYVTIDPEAVTDTSGNAFAGLADRNAWNFTVGTPTAVISVLNPTEFTTGGYVQQDTYTFTNAELGGFDVTGFDKLVLVVSQENGGGYVSVTYGGEALQLAKAGFSSSNKNTFVFYLDHPSVNGSLILDPSGTVNGVGGVLFGLTGTKPGFGETNSATASTVTLTTTAANSIVVATAVNNSDGTPPSSVSPLVRLGRIASGSSGHGSGYHPVIPVPGTTLDSTFSNDIRATVAVEFLAESVGPSNDFANWIGGFGLDAGDQDFEDDPDGDGLKNGVEAFFGTNPGVSSVGLTAVSKSGSVVSFQHPNPDTPLSDVTGFYEWSLDLATWYADDGVEGDGSTTLTTVATPDSPSANTTTVDATIGGTVPGKIFLRVVASQ